MQPLANSPGFEQQGKYSQELIIPEHERANEDTGQDV
jgi:hypothetical protein